MLTLRHVLNTSTALAISLLITSCGGGSPKKTKLNAEQIESKYGSGVVLIKNSYYYSISFNGGKELYFTGVNSNGDPENLTPNLNELNPAVSFGTGFFISKSGHIATNFHVAYPGIEDIESARKSIIDSFRSLANEWSNEINDINERLGILHLAIASDDLSYSDRNQYKQMYEELVEERNSKQEAVNLILSMGSMDVEPTVHTDIGVAYNDTHITNLSDFHDCVVVSTDSDHDLSIIQLKDKATPQGKYVFRIPSGKNNAKTDNERGDGRQNSSHGVKVGKKLYMIGYNLGPALALTNQGVKVQVTSGEITQDRDDATIMYSIAALHGSSGSPVIDEYGKLVAINFAGLDMTQNFNYGVKVTHLDKLFNNLQ